MRDDLKEQCDKIFLLWVFFIKQLLLLLDTPRKDFKFFEHSELFVFVINSPVYSPVGSQDTPVYSSLGSHYSPV